MRGWFQFGINPLNSSWVRVQNIVNPILVGNTETCGSVRRRLKRYTFSQLNFYQIKLDKKVFQRIRNNKSFDRYGVSIQISLNLGKTFLQISRIWNTPLTWILARVFIYVPPFISHISDFIYWTVLIFILIYFEWRDTKNQQYRKSYSLLDAFEFLNKTCGKCNSDWMKEERKPNDKAQ